MHILLFFVAGFIISLVLIAVFHQAFRNRADDFYVSKHNTNKITEEQIEKLVEKVLEEKELEEAEKPNPPQIFSKKTKKQKHNKNTDDDYYIV